MNQRPFIWVAVALWLVASLWSCLEQEKSTHSGQWKGQGHVQAVSTQTLPVQRQWRGTFDLGQGLYASNDFVGARLNGAVLSKDTLRVMITPENTPINFSPWYAFQLWADTVQTLVVKLTYLAGNSHRYLPKLSRDGESWQPVSEEQLAQGPIEGERGGRPLPRWVSMTLEVGPDTLWVAAQELLTSRHNAAWVRGLESLPYVSGQVIGQSRGGRPLPLLRIGKSDDRRMIIVLSRQHPPEVTGYLAMQAFVETIAADEPLAKRFRARYNTYVLPMANPDGVDQGHWRHNLGGVDLNRDWENANQPEVAAIQRFMRDKVQASGGKFYFGVDFHSTWQDIYYTIHPEHTGNMPGLVPAMIEATTQEMGLEPNIRPGQDDSLHVTSSRFFFYEYGAEALTYEIGDHTPRDLLRRKGEVSARQLMRLMLEADE